MIVDLIKSYLQANREQVAGRSDHLAALKRIAQAERSREAFAQGDQKLSQGFIKISRVAQGEPVALFGSDVPSLAFNRIEIFAGQDEGDARVPGNVLMSMLMNEQNLTELVMKPNRGDAVNWVTTESVMGWQLGPYIRDQLDERDLFETNLDDIAVRGKNPIKHLISKMKAAKLPLSAKAREEISNSLNQLDPASNFRFTQARYREELGKKLVKTKLEASHTVLNLDRILASKQQLLLNAPEGLATRSVDEIHQERLKNPILNTIMERFDRTEAEAFSEVVDWAICEFAVLNGVHGFNPDSCDVFGKTLVAMIGGVDDKGKREKLEAYGKDLARLRNMVTNPGILARQNNISPWALTLGLTHRGMDRRDMHTDFATTSGEGVVLDVSHALSENFFGEFKVRAGSQIVEIHMSAEEFMLALRGHPDGEAVRCTIQQIAGTTVKRAPYDQRYSSEIEKNKRDINAEISQELRQAKALAEQIMAGIGTKAEMADVIAAMGKLNDDLNAGIDRLEIVTREGADQIECSVAVHYAESMGSIEEALKQALPPDISFNLLK